MIIHMSYGTQQLYLPPYRGDITAVNSEELSAGTQSIYRSRKEQRLSRAEPIVANILHKDNTWWLECDGWRLNHRPPITSPAHSAAASYRAAGTAHNPFNISSAIFMLQMLKEDVSRIV